MTDTELAALIALDPTAKQRRHMATQVDAALEAWRAPLAVEWLEILRARPLLHGAYVLGAAGMLLVASPLGGLLLALFGARG